MTEHALLSASSAERWINCPGSVALCKDIPRTSSKYADEGTRAHDLAATLLTSSAALIEYSDEDMLEHAEKYVKLVREYTGNGTLMVEKRVDYSEYIGVPDSFGTSDALIISEDGEEVTVIDLKYGMGVRVEAEENPQLMLYALGAISEVSVLGYSPKRVRMVIHQPRLDHISEWDCGIETLLEFAELAKSAAANAMLCEGGPEDEFFLNPGEKQCRWCPAKATCPALKQFVADNIGGGFDDLTEIRIPDDDQELSKAMLAADLIELWIKSVRARVESRLLAGKPVEGFKLVEGRKGHRAWSDKAQAEQLLKSFRLKQQEMYDFSLISPTVAEKLLGEQPRRWSKVEGLIVRNDGKPSVAPAADKRPPLTIAPAEEGFEIINNEGDDNLC